MCIWTGSWSCGSFFHIILSIIWSGRSLLKWQVRELPVTWSSPLRLLYNNHTARSPASRDWLRQQNNHLGAWSPTLHPTASLRGLPPCAGPLTGSPPQRLHEAPGSRINVEEGSKGTRSSSPLSSCDIIHSTTCPPGRKVPRGRTHLIASSRHLQLS